MQTAYLARHGPHFLDPSELRFRKVHVQFSHLAAWAARSGFDQLKDASGSCGPYDFAVGLHSRWFYPLRNLVSLATCVSNAITKVVVFTDPAATAGGPMLPVEVVSRLLSQGAQATDLILPGEALLLFDEAAIKFSDIVQRWLAVHEELESVLDLYFSVQYLPEMYLEHRFLNYVQALEAYHTHRLGGTDLPEHEHAARMAAILGACPDQYREWLEQQLAYSNQPRLRRRLSEVIDRTHSAVLPLLRDKRTFVQKVLDTRNYHTHHDDRLRDKTARGAALGKINRVLGFMIQAFLLSELGFSDDEAIALLGENESYKREIEAVQLSP